MSTNLISVRRRGEWELGTTYQVADVVVYRNKTYVCGVSHVASAWVDGYWTLFNSNQASLLLVGQGPVGPRGATGDPGLAGPQGPVGPRGVRGYTGAPGVGSVGPQGQPGPAGATGSTGPQGEPGEKGDRGDRGFTGATGSQGPRGFQGEQGIQGVPGPAGSNGKDGADGRSVSIAGSVPTSADLPVLGSGDAGKGYITTDTGNLHVWDGTKYTDVGRIQGPPGPQGTQGIQGSQGPAGVQGQAGPAGSPGPTGPAGKDGATGATGPVGPVGPQGNPGPAGPTGAQGIQGPVGPTGPAGTGIMPGPAGTYYQTDYDGTVGWKAKNVFDFTSVPGGGGYTLVSFVVFNPPIESPSNIIFPLTINPGEYLSYSVDFTERPNPYAGTTGTFSGRIQLTPGTYPTWDEARAIFSADYMDLEGYNGGYVGLQTSRELYADVQPDYRHDDYVNGRVLLDLGEGSQVIAGASAFRIISDATSTKLNLAGLSTQIVTSAAWTTLRARDISMGSISFWNGHADPKVDARLQRHAQGPEYVGQGTPPPDSQPFYYGADGGTYTLMSGMRWWNPNAAPGMPCEWQYNTSDGWKVINGRSST